MRFCACNLIFERLSQVFMYMNPVWKVLMGSCKQNDLYKAFTDMKFNRLMVQNFWAAKKFWCCFNAFYNIMNPSFKKLTRKKNLIDAEFVNHFFVHFDSFIVWKWPKGLMLKRKTYFVSSMNLIRWWPVQLLTNLQGQMSHYRFLI